MYARNEILFPACVIPDLRDLCGAEWRQLVDRVLTLPDAHPENLACPLMMIRIDAVWNCETDSYRAMRGCSMCATQTLRRLKTTDAELLKLYEQALADIEAYLEQQNLAVRVA